MRFDLGTIIFSNLVFVPTLAIVLIRINNAYKTHNHINIIPFYARVTCNIAVAPADRLSSGLHEYRKKKTDFLNNTFMSGNRTFNVIFFFYTISMRAIKVALTRLRKRYRYLPPTLRYSYIYYIQYIHSVR